MVANPLRRGHPDGPLTGDDVLVLSTGWIRALDVPASGMCTDRAGLYVGGETALSTSSGALSASGTGTLWFPASDPAA